MKFSKYISKAVTPVMALFQKQHSCLSNKATTICGYSVCSLRQVPVRHNRGGKSTENKVRLAPPTMCRLTSARLYYLTKEGLVNHKRTNVRINEIVFEFSSSMTKTFPISHTSVRHTGRTINSPLIAKTSSHLFSNYSRTKNQKSSHQKREEWY